MKTNPMFPVGTIVRTNDGLSGIVSETHDYFAKSPSKGSYYIYGVKVNGVERGPYREIDLSNQEGK